MKKPQFSPVIIVGFLGILLIAFFLVSKASGIELVEPSSNHFDDKSPWGFYGFKRLLEKLDYDISIDYSNDTNNKSVILYIDYAQDDAFLKDEVVQWVKNGNTLIIDARIAEFFTESEFIKDIGNQKLLGYKDLKPNKGLIKDSLSIFESYDVIAETENEYIIINGSLGDGNIILIPDFRFFNNSLFKNDEIGKAYLISEIFKNLKERTIYLREKKATFNKNPSFLRDFFTGNFSYITYQVLFIFLLLAIFLGKRFIKPQQVKVREKRKISQHIYAVGNLYKQANAESLAEKIDIDFFKSIICKNKIPYIIDRNRYDKAIKGGNFKEGFLLREEITNEIKKEQK